MPIIEFSDAWAQGFGSRVFRVNDLNTTAAINVCGYLARDSVSGNANGRLVILKGTPPSDFTTLTSYSVRSSDALVVFYANNNVFSTPTSTNPLSIITPSGVTASASGTATWFWVNAYDTALGPTAPIRQQIIGTVGNPGSGADLEISSTTIVSGQGYRINAFRIAFPSVFTY